MINEAKSIEIATNVADGYGVDFEPLAEAALEMAEWKDKQFKEYLRKKKAEYLSQRDNANMWSEQWAVFHALTCTIHQIINELFGEEN